MTKEKEHTQPKYRETYGIVAMLDALGIRNATIEEAEAFSEKFRSLVLSTRDILERLATASALDLKEIYSKEKFHTHAFGDTVILVWEVPNTDAKLKALLVIGILLSVMVTVGLEQQMRLRGSMSIGKLVYSGDSVLGPVIADVASWVEIPDFVGVVATPTCGQHISYIGSKKEFFSETGLDSSFIHVFEKYDVPVKDGSFRRLWVVNWLPTEWQLKDKGEKKEVLEWYFNCSRKFDIPMGTEKKYDNTEKFIIDMLNIEKKEPITAPETLKKPPADSRK